MVMNIVRLACASIRMTNGRPMRVARWFLVLLTVVFAVEAIQPSHAGEYPVRTIKIVVPFPAGGPTDVAARLIAQSISSKLGKGVIVENHAGAAGRIGAKVVANASPDGYTLLLGGTNVNAINGALYPDIGFDPISSFAPIATICVDTLALAVSPACPSIHSRSLSNTPRTIRES
jgi:tripartite-type tricarboxylate transporter receptor subunit TctC